MAEKLIWALVAAIAIVGFFALQRMLARQVAGEPRADAVRVSGLPARALVLETHDTGRRVFRIFMLTRLKLSVDAPDGAFETEITVPISAVKVAEFAPGKTIKVRVDVQTGEVAVDQPQR